MAENYNRAKKEADKIEAKIIETLKEGINFRVEAGAGSGKTYSLNKVIEWLDANKKKEFNKNKQNVICITFTNAAVDVIKSRISSDSFIIPSTIHSFVWNAISQYQSALIDLVKDYKRSEEEENIIITKVQYTLGHRYIENSIQYLNHGDVLNLFVEMMKSKKFRNIFTSKYPIILIDEYQDSYKPIIDSFIEYFIAQNTGPQFGFFGDAWQTIYQSNNACGKIEHQNIKEIKKVSNFRSAPKIVNFLNSIRPNLPQYSAIDDFEGDIKVITCDDYSGYRRTDRAFNGDLPVEELKTRLDNLIVYIKNNKDLDPVYKMETDEREAVLFLRNTIREKGIDRPVIVSQSASTLTYIPEGYQLFGPRNHYYESVDSDFYALAKRHFDWDEKEDLDYSNTCSYVKKYDVDYILLQYWENSDFDDATDGCAVTIYTGSKYKVKEVQK